MQFTKKDDIFMISRITGSQDNILGISFGNNNSTNIEVMSWNLKDEGKIQTSIDEILNDVSLGLKEINQSLRTSYTISKIYYVPSESSRGAIYKFLTKTLIMHYHNGNEFKQAK